MGLLGEIAIQDNELAEALRGANEAGGTSTTFWCASALNVETVKRAKGLQTLKPTT
jgi:hypothetical protein